MASGIANSTLGQLVRVLCQFGSVLILSRLLAPGDFGLMAMAGPVYGFVLLFQDIGLGLATIQKPSLIHHEVSFFFWVNMGIGLLLALLLVAASPLAGAYYHEPRLTAVIAAMSVLIVISSIGSQSGAILMRRMQFRALAINGSLGAVSALVASLVAALVLKNYWALYIGMLVGTAVPGLGAVYAARWMPSRPAIARDARAMLNFGGGVTVSNASFFLARNTDNVLIGWRWGEESLGLYDRAYKLLLFPLQFVVGPTMYAMAPVLSRLQDDPKRYRGVFLAAMSQLLLAVWPGIIWAMVFSRSIVPKLLGDQWIGASGIFAALAVAGLLQVINGAPTPLFVSQGRTGELARWGIFYAVTCVAAFVIGLPYGVTVVAATYAFSECVRTPILWWYATRRGPVGPGDVIRTVMPHVAGAIVAWGVLAGLLLLFGPSSYLQLAVALIAAYVASVGTLAIFPGGRRTITLTINTVRNFANNKLKRKMA